MKRLKSVKQKEARVRISELSPERWEEFRKLRLDALKKDPKAFLSSYEDEVDFGKDVWQTRIKNVVFAIVGEKPVGMITSIRRNRRKNDHITDIFGVYVDKRFRGRGIGDKLLRRVISQTRENKNVSKIALSVIADQLPAVNLYLKYKFKVVGVLEDELRLDGKLYDELVMERILK